MNDFTPWHGMQVAPVYVSKALLAQAVKLDLLEAYDVTHDAYKVQGYWCVILPKIA